MHPPSRAQRIESSACRDGAAQVVVGEIPATWKPKEKRCVYLVRSWNTTGEKKSRWLIDDDSILRS
jgi:hypothetical protein